MSAVRSFIYSLPRSGSAWLSVFLTGRDSFCFHEPSVEGASLQDLFASRSERCVCAVDTAAYLTEGRPDAECFALVREKAEIADSLQRAGLVSPYYNIDAEYDKFQKATRGMAQIKHADLQHEFYRRHVFETVTKQLYDKRRSDAVASMNIQLDLVQFCNKVL